jgi:hypothetical protein
MRTDGDTQMGVRIPLNSLSRSSQKQPVNHETYFRMYVHRHSSNKIRLNNSVGLVYNCGPEGQGSTSNEVTNFLLPQLFPDRDCRYHYLMSKEN